MICNRFTIEMEYMDAGRELDALVAEKVMGFRRDSINPKYFHREETQADGHKWTRTCVLDFGLFDSKDKTELQFDGVNLIPFYSINLIAAWTVLEEMTRWSEINFQINYYNGDGQVCVKFDDLAKSEQGYHEEVGGLQYLPHTICIAALRAKGINL
jgi:hypothetical protein